MEELIESHRVVDLSCFIESEREYLLLQQQQQQQQEEVPVDGTIGIQQHMVM